MVNSALEKQLKELTERKKELEASIKSLETDAGIEKEIRSKFQVQKPGEKTVVIVEEEKREDSAASANANSSSDFFDGLWKFFKSIF